MIYPQPKPLPTILRKEARKKEKERSHKKFRDDVWARDGSLSRASHKPLVRSHTDRHKRGEVHHVLARSTDPDKIFDPSNGILLSSFEHMLAETPCPNDPAHCLLDIEGPEDRALPQTFIWRDIHGVEVKRRIG